MFAHEQTLYIIGLTQQNFKLILDLAPKDLVLKYYENLDNIDLKKADYIIAKLEIHEITTITDKLQNLNKNLDILTLCINKDDFYTLNLDDIHDIWPSEPNKNDINFYFKKLIKTIEFNNRFFEQKEIFETIINSTDDLIWVKDTIGRHKLFNNSFLDALPSAPDGHRKTREECTNRGHLFIWELSPEDYEQGEFICMESEIDVMRADATLTLNETLKVGSGELRSLITKKAPIHDRNGKIMGTIGVAKDVTQELLYKKQLKKNSIYRYAYRFI